MLKIVQTKYEKSGFFRVQLGGRGYRVQTVQLDRQVYGDEPRSAVNFLIIRTS